MFKYEETGTLEGQTCTNMAHCFTSPLPLEDAGGVAAESQQRTGKHREEEEEDEEEGLVELVVYQVSNTES